MADVDPGQIKHPLGQWCAGPFTPLAIIFRGADGEPHHGTEHHSLTGVWRGAPLPFSSTTTNLAGCVLLALRPTT